MNGYANGGGNGGTGDSCLEYALRIAYVYDRCLQTILEQRALQPKEPEKPAPTNVTPARRSNEGSGSFFAFDLGSLIGRDSSKSPKYPEKLLKVLDMALKKIAMGQEPKYSDQRFRRAAASFWGSTWADKNFQRQQRESRKVEDLILAFVTASTKVLKKDEELADGAWKYELNTHISLFLELVSDALHLTGQTPPELAARIDSYRTRLRTSDPPTKDPNERGSSDRGHGESDSISVRSQRKDHQASDGLRSSHTEAVARVFGLGEDALIGKLKELQTVCTEQAALEDLKSCLKRLNTESPFPYGPNDFAQPSLWTSYRQSEVSALSQMMLLMMQANPTLTQPSADRDRHSTGDLAARVDGLRLDAPPLQFTYIPADPRATYRALLDVLLDWDLEVLKTLPEDEDVSLGVLTPDHVALLSECALRWRLPSSFRAWVFLDAMVERCEQGAVPAACVHEASGMVDRVRMDSSEDTWATSDRQGWEKALLRRNLCLLGAVQTSIEYGTYRDPDFLEAVTDFLALDMQDAAHPDVARMSVAIADRIRMQAYEAYIAEATEKIDLEGSKTKGFAMLMATWIETQTKRLARKFGEPVNEKLDIVPLVLHQFMRLWIRDLEDAMVSNPHQSSAPMHVNEDVIEESLGLYKKSQKLVDMAKAFSEEDPVEYPLAPIFELTVRQWIDQTALKTRMWADQALSVDTFEPTTENGPSSSVTDLFDSFRSASTFLMDLDWPDEQQLAVFATRLAKIFSLSINDYCNKMEQLFARDMMQGEVVQPAQTAAKQKAWIEKAKSTIASLQGEKKIQAFFNFTPASCVKLNNIEAARQALDRLYQDMRVDDLAAYDIHPELHHSRAPDTFLFTVKIVLAEGLSLDGSSSKLPDSFVILSDEHGNRYAKTRTIYEDADPRWDETFDIPVRGTAWFMATVRHRAAAGKHDLLGRTYLRLDPSQHQDLIASDVLLPLDTRGHVLLRVSMEGERDDIQFHFGRAFRWLKRTEADMVRTFVDKMTPVLRSTLSRHSIKSVLKPPSSTPAVSLPKDYNEALNKLSSAYRSALANSSFAPAPGPGDLLIPPIPEKKRPPTDAEIESAIHPLFDYLDANNHTLASTLSRDAMQMVMAKLWKQILMTIEGLIVPPLSDKPSHMRELSDGELDIALKWLTFLRDFFYVGGDESGVPLSTLQNQKYNEIMSVRMFYDLGTDHLMEECVKGFQTSLKSRQLKMGKSMISQRNLGTIRARKSAKRQQLPSSANNSEMIMRILRMRPGTQEFLAQQLTTMSAVKLIDPKKSRSLMRR